MSMHELLANGTLPMSCMEQNPIPMQDDLIV